LRNTVIQSRTKFGENFLRCKLTTLLMVFSVHNTNYELKH
jgi:hypothetical protein